MKGIVLVLTALLIMSGCSGDQGTERTPAPPGESARAAAGGTIPLEELAGWRFYGMGEIGVDETENAVKMSEAEGSLGVTLVSPEAYGRNVTVSFKVKPATFESVNVVMISASDKDTGGDIQVPADYDGSFGLWTQGNVQNYLFAFHNAAHERLPFIVKDPGMEPLAEAEKHVTGERWHDIEVGRNGANLSMKIDGALVAETKDPTAESLPGGRVCFRLRGTPDAQASAWFKDVVIREE